MERNTNVEEAVRSILTWAQADPKEHECEWTEYSHLEQAHDLISYGHPCTFLGLTTRNESEAARALLLWQVKIKKHEHASRYLRYIRNGRGDVSCEIRELLHIVRGEQHLGAPTLTDLGTDTEELAHLLKRGYLRLARRSLATARAAIRRGKIDGNNLRPLERIPACANKAGVALTEIGITPPEYEAMRVRMWRMYAERLLAKRDKYSVSEILHIAEKEGWTLAELQTSRDELASMLRISARTKTHWRKHPKYLDRNSRFQNAVQLGLVTYEELEITPLSLSEEEKRGARSFLERMRDLLKSDADDAAIDRLDYSSVQHLRTILDQAGLSVTDIGTTDQELFEIEREITKRLAQRDLFEMRKSGRIVPSVNDTTRAQSWKKSSHS